MARTRSSRMLLTTLRRSVTAILVALFSWVILSQSYFLRWCFICICGWAGPLAVLLVFGTTLVCIMSLTRMFLEDIGAMTPKDLWQDWRDTPLVIDHRIQPRQQPRRERRRLLQERPLWTHRGRIRERRAAILNYHRGYNKQFGL